MTTSMQIWRVASYAASILNLSGRTTRLGDEAVEDLFNRIYQVCGSDLEVRYARAIFMEEYGIALQDLELAPPWK